MQKMPWMMHCFNVENQGAMMELSKNSYLSVLGHPHLDISKHTLFQKRALHKLPL